MYDVSQDFNKQMTANMRQTYGKVQIDYTDPFLDQSIAVQTNEQANTSYPSQVSDSISKPIGKIAALDGAWELDGTWCLAPGADEADTKQMGWWGSQLSQADGAFIEPYPTLTINFLSRPIQSLKVIGDSIRNEYPVDFIINLYDTNGNILHTETVTGNTEIGWSKALDNTINEVVKMDLIVQKWNMPNRQVKILEFFTSIQEVYEDDNILSIHLLEERDTSQGNLPIGNISSNEIDIKLDNQSRKFDIENKQSPLYQTIKQNRRIKAWLGAEVPAPTTWQDYAGKKWSDL